MSKTADVKTSVGEVEKRLRNVWQAVRAARYALEGSGVEYRSAWWEAQQTHAHGELREWQRRFGLPEDD